MRGFPENQKAEGPQAVHRIGTVVYARQPHTIIHGGQQNACHHRIRSLQGGVGGGFLSKDIPEEQHQRNVNSLYCKKIANSTARGGSLSMGSILYYDAKSF
jgi:hypothetical protein